MELLGAESYTAAKQNHKMLVEEYLCMNRNVCNENWTKSIAVGSKEFVEETKAYLNGRARGKIVQKTETNYQLRESSVFYNALLEAKNDDIGAENVYC